MIMATDMVDFAPETPGEELRFETVERAARAYERAKSLRMVVVFTTFAVSIARVAWPALFPRVGDAPTSAPAVLGICLFASFFVVSLEWSTRINWQSCLEGYEAYRRTTLTAAQRRLGALRFEPVTDPESRNP
jgi:hypothetical protein